MLKSTITSIISFHANATTNKAKHAIAIKLLQDNKLYGYISYIAENSVRHPKEHKPLLKEIMTALKYDASCILLDNKLISVS